MERDRLGSVVENAESGGCDRRTGDGEVSGHAPPGEAKDNADVLTDGVELKRERGAILKNVALRKS